MIFSRWKKIWLSFGITVVITGCWHGEKDTDPFESALNDDIPATLKIRDRKTATQRRSEALFAKAAAADNDVNTPLEKQLVFLREAAREQRAELARSKSSAEELQRRNAELQSSLVTTESRIARIEKVMRLLGEDPRALDDNSSLSAGGVLALPTERRAVRQSNSSTALPAELPELSKSPVQDKIRATVAADKVKITKSDIDDPFAKNIPLPKVRVAQPALEDQERIAKELVKQKILADISTLPDLVEDSGLTEIPMPENIAPASNHNGNWLDLPAIGSGWDDSTSGVNAITKNKNSISPVEQLWETGAPEKSAAKSKIILCDGDGKEANYIITRRPGDDMIEGALYQADAGNILVVTEVYASNAKAKLHPRFARGGLSSDTALVWLSHLPK